MPYIKAPFNFVPFDSKKVFYPDWAEQISQDIPFEDGLSGTIDLVMEAHSPIFVRNGNLEGKDMSTDQKDISFSNLNGKYFIPGTSIKGMLRNVLEILSFSKLSIYNDDRYALRDLRDAKNYMDKMVPNENNGSKFIRCGWLYKENDVYKIIDCEEPGRISFQNIDEVFKTNMFKFFQRGGGYQASNSKHKSAVFKYEKFKTVEAISELYYFLYGEKQYNLVDEGKGLPGRIVFTGQPSYRQLSKNQIQGEQEKWEGKGSEFIFWEKINPNVYELDNRVLKDFKFAYYDHDENRQSEDWKYWVKKLKNKERVPVFFQVDKNKEKVIHLGISYLYKLPYENSIGDIIKGQHFDKLDLAECLFGKVDSDSKNGITLKGRVHVGHAFAENGTTKLIDIRREVLSSPKASYYPLYLNQNSKNGKLDGNYKTYNNFASNLLKGRKRYPIHKNGIKSNTSNENDKIKTSFKPLDKGVKFNCKIAYHNLKPAELGALCSAITFHNTENCFHNIGMAKPLGYGKVSLTTKNIDTEKLASFLVAFEKQMNQFQHNWASSETLCELVTMAQEHDNVGNSALSYMKMETQGLNEFVMAKHRDNKEFLDKYSNLNNINKSCIKSLILSPESNVYSEVSTNSLSLQLETLLHNCNLIIEEKEKLRKSALLIIEEQKAKKLDYQNKMQEIANAQAKADAKMLAIEEEIRKNAKPKVLPQPTGKIETLISQLRTFLGKLKIDDTNKDSILTLFIDSYKLVSKPREKQEWEKRLPIFLKDYLGLDQNIEDLSKKILGKY
jgi:CRISPR-associated protein (TIGR03986 family)